MLKPDTRFISEEIFRLTQNEGPLADEIRDSVVRRESILFDNDILLAANYVDQMYRVSLTESQQNKAKATLFNVAIRMTELHKEIENPVQEQEDEDTASPASITMTQSFGSFEDEYEKFLDEKERGRKRQRFEGEKAEDFPCKISKFRHAFYTALTKVETFVRSSKLTVDKAIPLYPKIVQETAIAVTASPPSQVSVERLFSALRIIKTDLRGRLLKEDLVDSILFLRTNFK